MANLTSSSIANGSTIEASHITALYDVLTGAATYDNISVAGTSSNATSAVSASYASNATSASYALTASYAENGGGGGTIDTGSFYYSSSIDNDTISFYQGDGTKEEVIVNNVNDAVSASYAVTASHALNAGGATVNTGSFYYSSSVSNATITFYQGDGTTEGATVNNVTTAQTASYITASGVDGIVNAAASVGPVFKDPNGGSPILQKGNILAIGSVQLSGGTGLGAATPTLFGLSNGQDCYIMVTAVNGGGVVGGEIFDASISNGGGQGFVSITNAGGSSNALVSYVVFS